MPADDSVNGPRITIRKSVFIGSLHTIADAADARALVKKIKQSDRKARHVAFAFRIDGNPVIEGMSDDGEPRGTSGMPLLMLLRHNEITGKLLTVTRYYGGVKLGPGNLKRAYAEAAKEVISLSIS